MPAREGPLVGVGPTFAEAASSSRPRARALGLEQVLGDIRARAGRRHHGRILAAIDLLEGVVARYRVRKDDPTREDLERQMRQLP